MLVFYTLKIFESIIYVPQSEFDLLSDKKEHSNEKPPKEEEKNPVRNVFRLKLGHTQTHKN